MKDLFSSHAQDYATYRPQYPPELFTYIYEHVSAFNLAWDCGTGNGQAARELAKKFAKVYATDISEEQLKQAPLTNNVAYAKEPAEHSNLASGSVDLITVSQALHWFDFPAFYAEVNRVAKEEAVIAAWTYNLFTVDEEVDASIRTFYFDTLDNYWDAERKFVDNGYADIPFPYRAQEHPPLFIGANWSLEDLTGYINTWSGLKKYIAKNKVNPLTEIVEKLKKNWRRGERKRVQFPLHLKLAKVSSFQKSP